MKKLFFTALVAVAAIGGAYATNYYAAGATSATFSCPTGLSTCDVAYGSGNVYANPSTNPPTTEGQGSAIALSSIPYEL